MSSLPHFDPSSRPISFSAETDPVVSVIILGLRRAPYLVRALESVRAATSGVTFEVIVLLNEPDETLLEELDRCVSGIRVIAAKHNLGFGGGVNVASSVARGRHLLLLNDDTEVQPGWMESLVETAERRKVAAVGSLILFPDDTIQEAGSIIWADGWTFGVGKFLPGDSTRYDFERRVDYCSASSLLIRRDVFESLGGMDERYFPAYFEDADLSLRMDSLGESIWFQPRSRVRHFESASTSRPFRDFLMQRHHARFVERFARELAEHEPRVPANEPAVDRAVWRAMGNAIRVLLIDDRAPDPSYGSGLPRMADIVKDLALEQSIQCTYFTSVIDGDVEHELLSYLGIGVVDDPLDLHLARLGEPYAAVIVSRPHNYERYQATLRSTLPDMPIIYDAEALYHVRIERQAALATDPSRRAGLSDDAQSMRAVERAIAADADHIVCLSETEARFFEDEGARSVEVVAPYLSGIGPSSKSFAEREDAGFVAGWAAPDSPNADGLSWFVGEVLPLVLAEVPNFRLLVTGRNVPETILELANKSVVFVGNVENLTSFYDDRRVIISPMRYGSGVKNKTIEALQHAVPIVATGVAAEGIPLVDPEAFIVTEDPKRFAHAVAQLVTDKSVWSAQRDRLQRENEAAKTRNTVSWGERVLRVIEHGKDATAIGSRSGSSEHRET